jgi:predicted metal-dependent hydrolase
MNSNTPFSFKVAAPAYTTLTFEHKNTSINIKCHVKYKCIKNMNMRMIDGELLIAAPLNIDENRPIEWAYSKESWILKQLEAQQQQKAHKEKYGSSFNSQDHQKIPFMGGFVKLNLCVDRVNNFDFDGVNLSVYKYCNVDKNLESWYKIQAYEVFSHIMQHNIVKMNVQHKLKCKINPFELGRGKRLLGSCSSDGRIKISWYLILQPRFVIEYVIIHELAHLLHFNHSKEFWTTVEFYCPHYSLALLHIKKHGLIFD